MKTELNIPHQDKCPNCELYGVSKTDKPIRIVSEDRFNWLVKASTMLEDMDSGDDDWVDWRKEHNQLLLSGE